MKNMRVLPKKRLKEYGEKYRNAESNLSAWKSHVENSSWEKPLDIKNTCSNATIIDGNCVKFDIKGNHYRLIVRVYYDRQIVFIKWFGTHAQYDKINVKEVC